SFSNNVTLGTLALVPIGSSPLFAFYGVTNNGLYVSNLDLSMLTTTDELYVDPTLTIYFISASFNGTNNAESYLTNFFGGRLCWASSVTSLKPIKAPPISSNSPYHLTGSYASGNGQFNIAQTILLGQSSVIQASTDLVHWIPIYTNIASYSNVGASTVTDPNAKKFKSRFYRAVPWP